MVKVETRSLVLFEDPFWVGVFEKVENGKLTVAKQTFGAEPSMAEIYEFVLDHYYDLEFSPPVAARVRKEHTNPKRRQREARKMTAGRGTSTKSQQALQMQLEEKKLERKQFSKEQKEAEKRRRFELRQEKKKAKHRGK